MKYYDTILEEQETSINIAYDLEVIQVYTNRVDVIKNLSKEIGKPNIRDKKGKTYWMGATWEIPFKDISTISKLINKFLLTRILNPKKENLKKKMVLNK